MKLLRSIIGYPLLLISLVLGFVAAWLLIEEF
jgi:hypothetical protein